MSLETMRSLLFVPADDPARVARAYDRGADGVILDLEDGVAPERKEAARRTVIDALLAEPKRAVSLVRVNALDSKWGKGDLRALQGLSPAAVVVPKAEPVALGPWRELGLPLLALIETAIGVRSAYQLASRSEVRALMLGAADLAAQLGLIPHTSGLELLHVRSTLVVDSAAARIRPPFDGVCLEIRNAAAVAGEAECSRSLGYGGKACIHPAQVEVVNRVFSPSAAELEDALRTVAAFEEAARNGRGTTTIGGSMIDLPIVARARMTLAHARNGPTTNEENR